MTASDATQGSAAALDPEFVKELRCPLSRRPLVLEGNRLLCYESRKAYRIEDGIPVLLIEEASDLSEQEVPPQFRGKPPVTTPE